MVLHAKRRLQLVQGKRDQDLPSADSDMKEGSSKYQAHSSKKMASVDGIYDELQAKHNGKSSPEQLRVQSHSLEMGKHGSYDEPPDKPFSREGVPVPTTQLLGLQ